MSLILVVLLVIALALWFLTLLPALPHYGWATSWLAFFAVLLLAIIVVSGASPLALR